jgi:hypothetical protein
VALEFDVEVAGPNEGQHGAGEAADEAHQDGEVRDGSGHQHRADDHGDAPCQAPNLREILLRPWSKFFTKMNSKNDTNLELSIELPHRREVSFWLSPEQASFEQLAGSVEWQWI